MVEDVVDLEQTRDASDPLGKLLPGQAARPQRAGDVLEGRHMRKQREVLEGHADGPLLRRNVDHVLAIDQQATLLRRGHAGDQPQQDCLAGAGGAEDRHRLAVRHVQAVSFIACRPRHADQVFAFASTIARAVNSSRTRPTRTPLRSKARIGRTFSSSPASATARGGPVAAGRADERRHPAARDRSNGMGHEVAAETCRRGGFRRRPPFVLAASRQAK